MLQISAVLESYMIDDIATEGEELALRNTKMGLGRKILEIIKKVIVWLGGKISALKNLIMTKAKSFVSTDKIANSALKDIPKEINTANEIVVRAFNTAKSGNGESAREQIESLKESFDTHADKISDLFEKAEAGGKDSYVSEGTAKKLLSAVEKYQSQLVAIEKSISSSFGGPIATTLSTMASKMITNITKATNLITSMIKIPVFKGKVINDPGVALAKA